MDNPAVQRFNDELQSLLEIKPPVSKAKMVQVTKAAMRGIKSYKIIVQNIERFIAKCAPEFKVPGLYVIDSIVRQSIHQYGNNNKYGERFSRNLHQTFSELFYGCLPEDRQKIIRVLNLWEKNGVFSSKYISPLLDMGTKPRISQTRHKHVPNISPDDDDSPSNDPLLINKILELDDAAKKSRLIKHHQNQKPTDLGGTSSGIRFSKSNLGFDYEDDDDDGDETPTEAEPPLSTTLRMEDRKKSDLYHDGNQDNGNLRQPVLERWHKLMGQNLVNDDQATKISKKAENIRARSGSRSRSRSRSRTPNSPIHNRITSNDEHLDEYESSCSMSSQSDHVILDQERIAERKRKGFPEMRKGFLTICSTTLWLGHVPKTVSEADISDSFGEFGSITSIDLIPPRGCAYICMDRRQDALKALQESRNLKLNGNYIKMAWAPGKGLKDRKFKDFWEVELGASFIPISKIDGSTDLDTLEEGGVLDEDTLTLKIKEMREKKNHDIEKAEHNKQPPVSLATTLPLMTQPPPFTLPHNLTIPPPTQIPGLPIPFPQLPAKSSTLQENHDSSPNVDHLSMSRMAGPMISLPNPALFNAPPFSLPSLISNQVVPSQSLPLFPNPPPIFSRPPPSLVNNQQHFKISNEPDNEAAPSMRFSDTVESKDSNDRSMKYTKNNEAVYQDKGMINDVPLKDMQEERVPTFGRLLPRPGQQDLYPAEDALAGPSHFNEQQGSQVLMNNTREIQSTMMSQIQQPFIVNEQFNYRNDMMDRMMNPTYLEQPIQFTNFEPFDPSNQHGGMQLNPHFQNHGRGFNNNRKNKNRKNR